MSGSGPVTRSLSRKSKPEKMPEARHLNSTKNDENTEIAAGLQTSAPHPVLPQFASSDGLLQRSISDNPSTPIRISIPDEVSNPGSIPGSLPKNIEGNESSSDCVQESIQQNTDDETGESSGKRSRDENLDEDVGTSQANIKYAKPTDEEVEDSTSEEEETRRFNVLLLGPYYSYSRGTISYIVQTLLIPFLHVGEDCLNKLKLVSDLFGKLHHFGITRFAPKDDNCKLMLVEHATRKFPI